MKIIEELIQFKKPNYEFKYLLKAEEELGFDTLSTLIHRIYHWQKALYNPKKFLNHTEYNFDRGTYTIDHENISSGFQKFFKYCPKLKDVFKLDGNVISYQDSISHEERIIIMKKMDERLVLVRRITRKRPWRK